MKPLSSVSSIMLASCGYSQARQQSAKMLRQSRYCQRMNRHRWMIQDAILSGRWKESAEEWMRSMVNLFHS
jgi:hypothetical protein